MGWTEVRQSQAKLANLRAEDALKKGDAQAYQNFKGEQAYYLAKSEESKSDRFKSGIKKVGVIAGTVVATVVTAGAAAPAAVGIGAAAFAASAKATSEQTKADKAASVASIVSGGAFPGSLIDVATPPIVPGNKPVSGAGVQEGSDSGHWVFFALIAGVFMLLRRKR